MGLRPLVMGILNVTPDSFSDGGCFVEEHVAVRRGLEMADEGADIVDVGGESTRPGARIVPEDEECGRVIPVVAALSAKFSRHPRGPLISIDTRKASVAREAMEAGASIINDVSALEGDPGMADVAGKYGAGVVLMHMQGTPETMQNAPTYECVVDDVSEYLAGRMQAVKALGLREDSLALDWGIGFGKTTAHNISLVAGLERLLALGRPVVLGVSRKRFVGAITGADAEARLPGSLACAVWASARRGFTIWRVHDVKASRAAAAMVEALNRESQLWSG